MNNLKIAELWDQSRSEKMSVNRRPIFPVTLNP